MQTTKWMKTVIACGLLAASLGAGAMGPGGTCPQGGQGGKPPIEALLSLDSELRLNPEQAKAWEAFVATINSRRSEMMGFMMSQQAAAGESSAPETFRRNAQMMEMRQGMMQTLAEALEQLYASLNSEQQAQVNQTVAALGIGNH